jgi:hypothetical protein
MHMHIDKVDVQVPRRSKKVYAVNAISKPAILKPREKKEIERMETNDTKALTSSSAAAEF